MDGIEVSFFDRWKYRLIMMIREKLYERPAGMLLAEGEVPPSIRAINHLFEGRAVSSFLPYEVFTDDGLFKVTINETKKGYQGIYSFGLMLGTAKRLTASEVQALQETILEGLPVGYVLQCITASLPGDTGGYTAMVCMTAPSAADRSQVTATRDALQGQIEDLGLTTAILTPTELLVFIRSAFDKKGDTLGYDDEEIIRNQGGFAGLTLNATRMVLTDEGEPFREIAFFNGRRFGWNTYYPLSNLFPSLINQVEHIAVVNAVRSEKGLVGNFSIAEILQPGAVSVLEKKFEKNGWFLEQDRFNAHVTFLGMIPMAVNEGLVALLQKQRRWRPYTASQLGLIMPLPYQANRPVTVEAVQNVVSFEEAAHV